MLLWDMTSASPKYTFYQVWSKLGGHYLLITMRVFCAIQVHLCHFCETNSISGLQIWNWQIQVVLCTELGANRMTFIFCDFSELGKRFCSTFRPLVPLLWKYFSNDVMRNYISKSTIYFVPSMVQIGWKLLITRSILCHLNAFVPLFWHNF